MRVIRKQKADDHTAISLLARHTTVMPSKATTVFLCKCNKVYYSILKYNNITEVIEDEKEAGNTTCLKIPLSCILEMALLRGVHPQPHKETNTYYKSYSEVRLN